MGQYLGEKKEDRVGKVVGGAIFLFFIIAVILAVLMLLLARPLAILMQAPEEALDLTVLYVRICGGGIFFIIAYNVISSISRGIGDSKMPLLFVGIACIVNILGDLLFIAVFHWNVAGAALATVMAQAVSVILSVIIIRRKKTLFTMKWEYIRFNGEVGNFVRVGIPIAFQEIMTQLSFLALCAFINSLGLDASSVHGLLCCPECGCRTGTAREASNIHRNAHRQQYRHFYLSLILLPRRSSGNDLFKRCRSHCTRCRIPARICSRGCRNGNLVQLCGLFQRTSENAVRHAAGTCTNLYCTPSHVLFHEHSA